MYSTLGTNILLLMVILPSDHTQVMLIRTPALAPALAPALVPKWRKRYSKFIP